MDLGGSFNRDGIVSDGSTFSSTGGLDGGGNALSSELLGTSQTWNGTPFAIGAAGASDVVSATGQTISLHAGQYASLQLLAAAVNGNQVNQTFTVTYSDGTTATFTRSISDWYTPRNYPGESTAVAMSYRDGSDGTTDSRPFYVYGYSLSLDATKTVSSITLPNDANVELLSATLSPAADTTLQPSAVPAPASAGPELLVPAYFNASSNTYWQDLADAARRVPLTAIMNVDNGPGTGLNPDLATAVDNVRAAGGHVIGYVRTLDGSRPLGDVEADIDQYHRLYHIDGIFVDEMSNDPSAQMLDYYAAIYEHAKALNPAYRVIGNPGGNTEEAYLTRPTADALVTFEGSGAAYLGFTPAAWVSKYSSDHFAHIVFDVASPATMTRVLDRASELHAGSAFVNDASTSTFVSLPTYFDQEVAST
jgi:hypothetical protein